MYRLKQILGVGADFLLEGMEEGVSEDQEKAVLQENIMGSPEHLFCKQLGVMEQITQLYVEGSSGMSRRNKLINKYTVSMAGIPEPCDTVYFYVRCIDDYK